MTGQRLAVAAVLALGVASAFGQADERSPHIGYIYPSGGKQGTTFQVMVGGQFLRGASNAYVSGEGVQATVIRHYPPLRVFEKGQREALRDKLRELVARRWAELARDGQVEPTPPWQQLGGLGPGRQRSKDDPSAEEPVALPEHPLLYNIEKKSLRELLHVAQALRNQRKGQRNAQLAETVLVEITIAREAEPGQRELRLRTGLGLTNPMVFEVGALKEVRELELGEARILGRLPPEPPLKLPIVLNGQIMPGDADRFRFEAQQGQQLVVETHARQLIPYLADAVPGWFQATLSLRDAQGNELAYVDDYRFNPDPCCATRYLPTVCTSWRSAIRSTAAARISSIASLWESVRSSRRSSRWVAKSGRNAMCRSRAGT